MKKFLFTFLFVTLFFVFGKETFAKGYDIKSAKIDVLINEDGSADITETRQYEFDGSYTFAYQYINLRAKCVGCSNYFIDSVSVTDGLNPLRFEESIERDQHYIKWFYKASDETKTFTLKYRVRNAVTNHKDTSEFYWQLIGDEWDEGVDEVYAKVALPFDAPDDHLYAFGHGPLNGKINILDSKNIEFSAMNLSKKKFFEVRVLFPKLEKGYSQNGQSTKEEILNEESKLQKDTNAKSSFYKIVLLILTFFCSIAAILVMARTIYWIIRWKRIGDDLPIKEANLANSLHEPPSNLHPALVETLLSFSNKPSGKSIVASIIDLIHKKLIKITVKKREPMFGIIRQEPETILEKVPHKVTNLHIYEKKLMEFLFKSNNKITFDDIKKFGRTRSTETKEFWKWWEESAVEQLVLEGYFDSKANKAAKDMSIELKLS